MGRQVDQNGINLNYNRISSRLEVEQFHYSFITGGNCHSRRRDDVYRGEIREVFPTKGLRSGLTPSGAPVVFVRVSMVPAEHQPLSLSELPIGINQVDQPLNIFFPLSQQLLLLLQMGLGQL